MEPINIVNKLPASMFFLVVSGVVVAADIPMTGLVYRLDASAGAPAITCDEQGRVTRWASSACDPALTSVYGNVAFEGLDADGWGLPTYKATGFGGRGSLVFGYDTDGTTSLPTCLRSDVTTSNRTVIIVFQCPTRMDFEYFWGNSYRDTGIGLTYYYMKMPSTSMGGPVWMDGLRLESDTVAYPASKIVAVEGSQALAETEEYASLSRAGLICRSCIGAYAPLNENWSWPKTRAMRGEIAEVIVYNRQLSDDEHALVYEVLRRKWFSDFKIWTGKGATSNWNDGGNWSGGQAPAAGANVVIADAQVTVTADVHVAEMIADSTTFTLANGAKLRVDAISQDAVSSVSVTGNGSFVKLGAGTVSVRGEWDFGVPFVLGAGKLDLVGGSLSVPAITGAGVVTNSLEKAGLLVISNIESSDLTYVAGNVKILKSGEGCLSIAKSVSSGKLEIEQGVVKAVTNAVPEAFPGLTLHLDASRSETVVCDNDGYVREWHSVVGGVVLTPQSQNGDNAFYVSNSYGDLPAISFGQTKAIAYSGNALVGNRSVCNRTIILVNRPNADLAGNMSGVYGGWHVDFGIRRETLSTYYWDDDGGVLKGRNGDQAYVNGVLEYNPESGLVPQAQSGGKTYTWSADWGSWSRTTPHVLTTICAETDVGKNTVTPAVGSYFTSWTRAWVGDIYEIIVYDRVLTEDERKTLETALMRKWNILGNVSQEKVPGVTEITNVFSASSMLHVSGDSILDFGGMSQVLSTLVVDARVANTYPCLTITGIPGSLSLSAIDFSLVSETGLKTCQRVLNVPGGLSGTFKSETVPSDIKVKYLPTEVQIRENLGLLLIFR